MCFFLFPLTLHTHTKKKFQSVNVGILTSHHFLFPYFLLIQPLTKQDRCILSFISFFSLANIFFLIFSFLVPLFSFIPLYSLVLLFSYIPLFSFILSFSFIPLFPLFLFFPFPLFFLY